MLLKLVSLKWATTLNVFVENRKTHLSVMHPGSFSGQMPQPCDLVTFHLYSCNEWNIIEDHSEFHSGIERIGSSRLVWTSQIGRSMNTVYSCLPNTMTIKGKNILKSLKTHFLKYHQRLCHNYSQLLGK